MKKYAHTFDIAFTVVNDCEDPYSTTIEELSRALTERIRSVVMQDDLEAFGLVDSEEED